MGAAGDAGTVHQLLAVTADRAAAVDTAEVDLLPGAADDGAADGRAAGDVLPGDGTAHQGVAGDGAGDNVLLARHRRVLRDSTAMEELHTAGADQVAGGAATGEDVLVTAAGDHRILGNATAGDHLVAHYRTRDVVAALQHL